MSMRGSHRIVVAETEIKQEILLRMLFVMLFRLGGQQSFTVKEMTDIMDFADKMTLALDKEDTTILKFVSTKIHIPIK